MSGTGLPQAITLDSAGSVQGPGKHLSCFRLTNSLVTKYDIYKGLANILDYNATSNQQLIWNSAQMSFRISNSSRCLAFDPSFSNPNIIGVSSNGGSLVFKQCNSSDTSQRIKFNLSDLSMRPLKNKALCLTVLEFTSYGVYWSNCISNIPPEQQWLIQNISMDAYCDISNYFGVQALRLCRADSLSSQTSM